MLFDPAHRQLLKFALVGAFGSVVNLAMLYLIRELGGVHYIFAALLSSQIALTVNFIANDAWTFKGSKRHGYLARFGRYWLISHGTILLDLGILYFLTTFFSLYYIISMLIAILVSASINYLLNMKHTFHA
ncbi:MAG: GtrA family protein [Candidatus Micrarchaeota archaeon]